MRVTRQDLREVSRGTGDKIIDEMAVPSYTHWNPLIRWLMWKRLAIVQDFCKGSYVERALDYGTGSGVMLPFLSQIAGRVTAIDKFITPATKLCDHYQLNNVELHEIDTLPIPLPDESMDLILCLDVLEHIQQIQDVAEEIARVLRPGGKLIVSGPSENLLYKIGRLFAGFQKRATYHRWNIDAVNESLKAQLTLVRQKTLLGPIRLFDISVFQNRHATTLHQLEIKQSYE